MIYGVKSKTIYIETSVGANKFRMQLNNELGLPKDSIILGMQTRSQFTASYIGANGLNLVNSNVFVNSYLTLKYRNETNNIVDILSEVYLPDLNRVLIFDPVPSYCIDWNESFIQINNRALADVNNLECYEIIVYYIDNCKEFKPKQIYFNGLQYAGIKKARFEISVNATQRQYKLSNTPNIGLNQDSTIIGFSTDQNSFPLTGEVLPFANLQSIYLTLKKGTESFVESFPAVVNRGINGVQFFYDLEYVPIVPTKNNEIDWQQSNILVQQTLGLASDMVFSFDLYWID